MFRSVTDIECYTKWKVICNCRPCKTNKKNWFFFFKCHYQNPWKLNRRPECLTQIFIKHPFHTVQSHFNPPTVNCHKLDFLSETAKSTSYKQDSKDTTCLEVNTKACRKQQLGGRGSLQAPYELCYGAPPLSEQGTALTSPPESFRHRNAATISSDCVAS